MGTKILFLALAALLSFSCQAQDYDQIRAKLEALSDSSLAFRKNVMPIMKKYGVDSPQMDSLKRVILKFDSTSSAEVQLILEKYGWLGSSRIGEKANKAFFLTIQHAQDNQLREKYFPLLEASANKKESSLVDMATMKDRILVEKGQKQIYGTQYRYNEGKRELLPVIDSQRLNDRRKEVGLGEIDIPIKTPKQ